jgi:hypothetical protein
MPTENELSTPKSALLDAWRRGERLPSAPAGIEPTEPGVPFALTTEQERIWFLELFYGPSAANNLFFAARVGGELDQAALVGAVDDVVDRHDILRSTVAL